eukprot:2457201-Alexandrium_andersonii.AAC.1
MTSVASVIAASKHLSPVSSVARACRASLDCIRPDARQPHAELRRDGRPRRASDALAAERRDAEAVMHHAVRWRCKFLPRVGPDSEYSELPN